MDAPPARAASGRRRRTVRRADLVLGWISAAGGAIALLVVVLTAQWLSLGTLLGIVLIANAAVRLLPGRRSRRG